MTEPDTAMMIVQAAPWSPATPGLISGDVVAVKGFSSETEFAQYRGKLGGKIVLLGRAPTAPDVFPIERPLFERLDQRRLDEFAAESPNQGQDESERFEAVFERMEFFERTGRFFADEKVAAVIVPSGNNAKGGASGGTLYADTNYTFGWWAYRKDRAMRVPLVITAIEHYGRMSRLLASNVPVRAEVNVDTEFNGDAEESRNVFAEIPGQDPKHEHEVVMVTAHLDSWAAGTGATDDGAGVVIAMEAMRILAALKVQPARSIRLALWTAEEQGALGSREYVRRHVADIPLASSPAQLRMPEFLRKVAAPVTPKEEHEKLSAVYTLDAGGGRIRGISLANNPALIPIFRDWLEPLKSLGVTMIRTRGDCGGDCFSFEQAGIPTPSFKQDPLDYDTRTQHTNMDTFEHLIPEDLRQAATIVASVLYSTAMRNGMLPRK